jgi:YVTN family beta-propeller protein
LIYLLDSGMPIVSTATNTVVGGLTGLGTYPELLSITPNGSFLYITNSTDHTVSVVRTSDNTTIATVPLGNHATSISAAPDSTAVYVTTASNTSTDAVVVIRTSDNTVIASPAIGSGTANQAVTPDGSLVLLPAYNTDRALWILTTSTETAEEWVPSTTVGTFSTLLLDGIKATNLGSGLAGFSGPTFLRQPPTPTPPPANSNFLGMAVTTDGAFVYVGNTSNSGTPIYVFRTSDNKWVDTIPAGVGPSYLCAHPDGTKIYASNYYDNTVSVIDTATRTVTATISFLSQPQGLVCSPDGSILYVANFGANNIQPINTTTLALSPTIATDSLPQNMCITPDGAHLYVTNSGTTAIQVIRTSDGTVIANFTSAGIGAAHGIAVTPDGTKVYVNVFLNAPPYGGVLDITVASNTVAATIVIGDGHSGLAVTPDGAHVYALNAYSSSISVIRTSDNTVVATISLFTSFSLPFIVGPQYIVINPAGTFAYVNGQMESPAPTALIDVIHLTNNTLYTSVSSFVTPPVINNGTYSQYQLDGAALTNLGDGRVDIRLPVVFNDADPTVHTNLQNGGDQPSPIDNLQAGVVNLGSQTGNWNPNALGAIGSYSTIGGGADNQAGPTGYETISGGAGNTANGNSAVIGGGYNNQVNADYATVGGGNSNHATNEGATVGGGEGNQAGGFCATISGGSGNQAKGSYAYAEGLNVNSDGEASHAEGDGTGSQGHASHTEGLGTFAEGEAAHAEGVGTQANSRGAHAEGNATTAQNNYAHTEGDGTNAEGLAAHAEGQNTLAYANYSHAAGIGSASPYEGSYTHSSGPGSTYNNGNQPTSGGATQHSVLTMAGQTPGVAVGESVVLDFGQSGGDYIQFSRFNSYPGVVLVVTAIARSGTDMAPVVRAFRQMFVGWGNGSSLHLSASGVQESIGDASTASWTLTGAITAPFGQDCFTLTFTTGADTAAVVVTAKVEMVEVSNFPSS